MMLSHLFELVLTCTLLGISWCFGKKCTCGGDDGDPPVGCVNCKDELVSPYIEVTVSGVSNLVCGTCTSINGVWVIPIVASGAFCSGGVILPTAVCGSTISMSVLIRTVSGNFWLEVQYFGSGGFFGSMFFRKVLTKPVDCLTFSGLVVPFLGGTGGNCAWPASVTVTSVF